jgi:hypothetical protein
LNTNKQQKSKKQKATKATKSKKALKECPLSAFFALLISNHVIPTPVFQIKKN